MTRILASYRVPAALTVVVATFALALFAVGLRVDPGVESLMPSGGGDLARLREFNETFGPDEIIVLAIHGEPLFTTGNLVRIDELTREMEGLPHVVRVLSPTNVQDIDGDELGPFPVVPYEEVEDGSMSPAEMGEMLAAHPLYGDLLVASDERTAAILVSVERVEGNDAYRREIVESVRALAGDPGPGLSARVAGIPVEKVDIPAFIARDQKIAVPLIILVMAVVTALLYRHPVGIVVPLGVMLTSLIWTLGFYALAGRMLNPVTALLSPVVMVVSMAGAIHYLNHFLAAEAAGLARPDALARAFRRARVPCFNAALTTAVGFASLLIMPIPAIREFGLFTAIGVMIAYGLTMVLVPLLLAWLPDFPDRVSSAFEAGPVERALRVLVIRIHKHPVAVALAAVAVLLLVTAGIANLRLETHMIRSLRADSALYQATTYIDENLTGVNSLEMLIPGVDAGDPDLLRRVQRFERAVSRLPGVRKVTGLPDLYSRVNRAFHEGDDAFERIPEGPVARQDVQDADDLLDEYAPEARTRFLSPDRATLCIEARVTGMNTAQARALFAAIRSSAVEAGLEDVSLTGSFVVLTNMSTSLVRNQVRGLLSALGIILTIMAVQFRSLRLGLLCAVPSVAPVLMVYGLMGWVGIALSVPTAMIASIAIGMTVDNTIHLMARYRQEFEENGDRMIALEAMMTGSGRALVYSTLTVALGFCTGIVGSFRPTVHFAILTAGALVLGLICVVVLLPLLVVVFKPLRRHERVAAAVLMALLLVPAAGAARAGEKPVSPVLGDQFGGTDGPGLHRGELLLLLHGKPSSLRRMKTWEGKIRGQTDRPLHILRVIDLRELRGKKTEDEVRKRLLDRVPDDVAILMDWEGAVAREYALADVEISVTVVDGSGRDCLTIEGPVSSEGLSRAVDLLSSVGQEGSCPI